MESMKILFIYGNYLNPIWIKKSMIDFTIKRIKSEKEKPILKIRKIQYLNVKEKNDKRNIPNVQRSPLGLENIQGNIKENGIKILAKKKKRSIGLNADNIKSYTQRSLKSLLKNVRNTIKEPRRSENKNLVLQKRKELGVQIDDVRKRINVQFVQVKKNYKYTIYPILKAIT